MKQKRIILIVFILIALAVLLFILTYSKKGCSSDMHVNENEGIIFIDNCYDYNVLGRAFNQLSNSGDLRCGNSRWCGWYNIQANSGIVVDECKDLNKEDFCYYTERNITISQIEIKARALKNITFSCNYNSEPNWCDYEIRECDAWRIGLFDWDICPPNMNLEDCGKYFNVTIC
jgi:hypothetical protein